MRDPVAGAGAVCPARSLVWVSSQGAERSRSRGGRSGGLGRIGTQGTGVEDLGQGTPQRVETALQLVYHPCNTPPTRRRLPLQPS